MRRIRYQQDAVRINEIDVDGTVLTHMDAAQIVDSGYIVCNICAGK